MAQPMETLEMSHWGRLPLISTNQIHHLPTHSQLWVYFHQKSNLPFRGLNDGWKEGLEPKCSLQNCLQNRNWKTDKRENFPGSSLIAQKKWPFKWDPSLNKQIGKHHLAFINLYPPQSKLGPPFQASDIEGRKPTQTNLVNIKLSSRPSHLLCMKVGFEKHLNLHGAKTHKKKFRSKLIFLRTQSSGLPSFSYHKMAFISSEGVS